MADSGKNRFVKGLVKAARTNFYYAFVFLPRPKREAIFAAYAFSRHTDDLVDDARSPEQAREALLAWRGELRACYNGTPGHPVARSLQRALQRYPIREEHFELLIEGVEMDLDRSRYQTFEDLYQYCYRVASAIGLICIEIFGYRNPRARDYAINLGIALQLTNILRDIAEDARRGRIYLPLDDLNRFGYSESSLLQGIYDERFVRLMEFQCQRAHSYYRKASRLIPAEDARRLFSAEIMARTYGRILTRIERTQYDVFRRPVRIGNLHKLLIAVRVLLSGRTPVSKSHL